MHISIPPALEQQIANRARAEGLALNNYVERLLLEDEECRKFFEKLMAELPASSDELFNELRTRRSFAKQQGMAS